MNKFIKSGSKLLLFITGFFIASLFVDQANLLDIIIGESTNVDIQHPEEVEASFEYNTPVLDQVSFAKVVSSGKSSLNKVKGPQSISKKLIVDEDSPSTASVKIDATILSNAFENEQQFSYTFVLIRNGIYLHNRTLLI